MNIYSLGEMKLKILITFLYFNFLSVFAYGFDDIAPVDFGVIAPLSTERVTVNADRAVEDARELFNKTYSVGNTQYGSCQPAFTNEAACLLSGIVYNYALNYAQIIKMNNDFRVNVTDAAVDKDFSVQDSDLQTIMVNLSELKARGYYFFKNGKVRLPGPPVREISLADFNNPSSLIGPDKLTAVQVTEVSNILNSLPTGAVTIADVVSASNDYSVHVDPIDNSGNPDSTTSGLFGGRTIANLTVNLNGGVISHQLANIFDVVSYIYEDYDDDGNFIVTATPP